jgi:hypothetical protein
MDSEQFVRELSVIEKGTLVEFVLEPASVALVGKLITKQVYVSGYFMNKEHNARESVHYARIAHKKDQAGNFFDEKLIFSTSILEIRPIKEVYVPHSS